MNRTLGYLTFLAAAALAMPAGAVTWSTYTDTVGTCGTTTCTVTDSSGGGTIKYRAYSNSAWMPSDAPGTGIGPVGQNTAYQTNGGTLGGNWVNANLAYYGTQSGFGIKNTVQNAVTEEDVSPEHAVDNKEVLDILVIELPNNAGMAWDLTNFMLGWAQENGAGTSTDVSMFIGGKNLAAGYDFAANNVCIDTNGGTCAGSMTKLSTLGGGFTNITSFLSNSGNNLSQDTSYSINDAPLTGNYLIVSGRLGESDDAFKFKSITGTQVKVPLPGTVALLGLGLFGLVANRRRAAAQA